MLLGLSDCILPTEIERVGHALKLIVLMCNTAVLVNSHAMLCFAISTGAHATARITERFSLLH